MGRNWGKECEFGGKAGQSQWSKRSNVNREREEINLNGGEKGGAAACQLDINSNTHARQDMHAHGMCERCRHTTAEAEKKTRLPLPPLVSKVWSVGWIWIEPSH